MSLVGFLVLASAASLMVQVVHTKEKCAFFSKQTTLVPVGDGHNVTLTFSVVNTCKGNNSSMKSLKVAKLGDSFASGIICNMQFYDTFWLGTASCAYSNISQTFTLTHKIDNYGNETWILVGVLQNGYIFNKTVPIQMVSRSKSTHVSYILVVSVSVGVIVAITFVTLVTVCCVRSNNNITVETRPRMDSYAKPDQRSSHRQATAITNEVFRSSNVSLMIENDIYDGRAFQLT